MYLVVMSSDMFLITSLGAKGTFFISLQFHLGAFDSTSSRPQLVLHTVEFSSDAFDGTCSRQHLSLLHADATAI
jgi:hypothetical protein